MRIPLEEYIPYSLPALLVLALFYGIYLAKQWRQKRRGIQTMQIGRGKATHTVEALLRIVVTGGIYAYSRNPAFLGFDLQYIGVLLMYCNLLTGMFTVFAIVMLHLQVLQEERYLTDAFGGAYLEYRHRVFRYLGRRKG